MEFGVCSFFIIFLGLLGLFFSVFEKKILGVLSTTINLVLMYLIYSTQNIIYFKILFSMCIIYIILDIILENKEFVKKFLFIALLIGMYLGI